MAKNTQNTMEEHEIIKIFLVNSYQPIDSVMDGKQRRYFLPMVQNERIEHIYHNFARSFKMFYEKH